MHTKVRTVKIVFNTIFIITEFDELHFNVH